MKKYFENRFEFNKYMKQHKPKEVWWDTFSKEEPCLIFSFNDGNIFRGVYNHQSFFSGKEKFTWLFKDKMYVIL